MSEALHATHPRTAPIVSALEGAVGVAVIEHAVALVAALA